MYFVLLMETNIYTSSLLQRAMNLIAAIVCSIFGIVCGLCVVYLFMYCISMCARRHSSSVVGEEPKV